jgi:hypothetical protein
MAAMIPLWFYGIDAVMFFISSLIAFFISYYATKLFVVTRKYAHMYLYLAFMILGLGMLAISLTSGYSYLTYEECREQGCQLGLLSTTVFDIDDFGYYIYYGLSIIGYSLLIITYLFDKQKIQLLVLGGAGVLAVIFFGIGIFKLAVYLDYFLQFCLLSILMLGAILFNQLQKAEKSLEGRLVVWGFSGILVSHLLHFFGMFDIMYVLAFISLIIGYLCLLAMIIRVRH